MAVFINEIHYDNEGGDAGEFIEIAGTAGTDLAGYSLVLYNGNNGEQYDAIALSGSIDDEGNGFGALSFERAGIQNGAPDGLALVSPDNTVLQFLSYEGSFVAVGGPADGMTSTDIGVAELGSDAIGNSLQLTGEGAEAGDFTWTGPVAESPGDLNDGQSFSGGTGTYDLQVTEIWFGQDGEDVTGDWFEIVNRGTATWTAATDGPLFYDDDSQDAGDAAAINGITSLAPGETAIVVIGGEADATTFANVWDDAIDLTGVAIGYADGSGLGQGGDAVTLFVDAGANGVEATDIVDVVAYPDAAANSGQSYDVDAGQFSVEGTNGAVSTLVTGGEDGTEPAVGSPGNGPALVEEPVDYGAPTASAEGSLSLIGSIGGLNGAEITAFDSGSQTLWVTSGDGLQIIDISDPAAPSIVASIDPAANGSSASDVTSVAISNGLVSAAVPGADTQAPGSVHFYDATTFAFIGAVTVGALPDMLTFTPDGSTLLVANEASPGDDIDPEGSVSVITGIPSILADGNVDGLTNQTAGFTAFDASQAELEAAGLRIFPGQTLSNDVEPEYITVSADGTKAFVTLQEANAVAVLDIATATITEIQPLGVKDHSLAGNELDVSNEDGVIDLQTVDNLVGLYMPDSIASYSIGGMTYYVTANEGDARNADERVSNAVIDASVDTNGLDRLTISTIDGDTDGDGDIDILHSYGARSFSIWDENGNQVYDSGSDIARIVATETAELFNANDSSPSEFDNRSDDKGAEPEGATVGVIDGVPYAFIGLERVGTVMMFDVSDPSSPVYVDSLPANDPTSDVVNVAPEGLTFIDAANSPSGVAMLAISYEDSNTIRLVEVLTPEVTKISEIQGEGAESALVGEVRTVTAVVVGDFQDGDGDEGRNLGGFYLQEEDANSDGNASTSEGIFVFDGSFGTDVSIGDVVRVTGTVTEYFGETQLASISEVTVIEQNVALPTAAVIDLPAMGTSFSQDGDVQPDLEAYEGMLVTIPQTLTITEQFQLDRFNEIKLFAADGFEQAGPGGTTITGERPFQYSQFNDPDAEGNAAYLQETGSRTITYDDGLNSQNNPINNLDGFQDYNTTNAPTMGDTITGLTGVLDYKWGGNSASGATWRVRAAEDGTNTVEDTNPRPAEEVSVDGSLKVASFNVLNFFTTLDEFPDTAADNVGPDQDQEPRGADSSPQAAVDGVGPTEEYDRQLSKLVEAISALDADILGLIEIENDFLAPGVSPGDQSAQDDRGIAIEALVEALNERLGEGTYAAVYPGQEFVGGDAIANGMIYKPGTVRIAEGTSPAILTDADVDQAILDRSTEDNNGDAPGGSVFEGANTSRSPLAVTFEEIGGDQQELTVVVNHFKSKGGSGEGADADAGDGAGNYNNMRLLAAEALDAWLDTHPTGSNTGNVMLLGDFNAYGSEDPIDYLTEAGFVDVAAAFLDTAYNYLFDGLLGTLDYAFASMELFSQVVDALEYHINADEADALDYNLEFGRDPAIFDGDVPYRASDHDPVLVGLNLEAPMEENFTLELLHLSDQEGATNAIEDAPNLSAVLNALREQDLGDDGIADNTLTIASGDLFIPGVFANASNALYGAAGIADIQIQNELGIQASALGNHDFDYGTQALAALINGSAGEGSEAGGTILGQDFLGTAFPYLSTNLDFSTDANLAPLAVEGGQAPQGNVVTSSVVIDVNGENIGVVGVTTPILASISSSGDVGILPGDFANNPTAEQLDALAAEIQIEVDALLAANPNMDKVILSAHMQQLVIEQELATRLSGVDIIIAGGSDTRLFDDNDRPRDGDSDQGQYPIFTTDVDGNPIAVVNTDGQYLYVGRLAVEFDSNGHIIVDSYDAEVSGAYATDAQGVADLGAEDLVDAEIQQIVDEIEAQIIATESNVFGVSDVFLNGERSGTDDPSDPDGVRTQETNLGNLTADANLAYANEMAASLGEGEPVLVSIKNGGGIRASIGQVTVPAGGSEAVRSSNEALLDSQGNVIKEEGGISQTDIQSSLAFNNALTLLTLTRAELLQVLEHGIAGLPNAAGQFPQLSGIEMSYDTDLPAGSRIVNAAIVDADGNAIANLMIDGEIAGDPSQAFRIVTLGFLADGGDGYPFPTGDSIDRVDLNDLDGDGEADGVSDGDATFAENGTEQDAFAEYLSDNFRDTPYSLEDEGREEDVRIQNLDYRDDTVSLLIGGDIPYVGTDMPETFTGTDQDDTFLAGGGDDTVYAGEGDDLAAGQGGNDTIFGQGGNDTLYGGDGDDMLYGGDGDDLIAGGADDDTIFGGAGNDVLGGQAGDDTITGGDGNDAIYGGSGADLLAGQAGDDIVRGGGGDDTIYGGEGNDILAGQGGNDTVFGGSGNDEVYGGGGDDLLYGQDGDDLVTGGAGDDMIFGGRGNDRLAGQDGDDVINGGAGDDILYGGSGADLFVYDAPSFGNDLIGDFEDGIDLLSFSSDLASDISDFMITGNGTNMVELGLLDFDGNATGDTITLTGSNPITIDASDFQFAA